MANDPRLAGQVVPCPHCRNPLTMPPAPPAAVFQGQQPIGRPPVPVAPPPSSANPLLAFLDEPEQPQPTSSDPLDFLGGPSSRQATSPRLWDGTPQASVEVRWNHACGNVAGGQSGRRLSGNSSGSPSGGSGQHLSWRQISKHPIAIAVAVARRSRSQSYAGSTKRKCAGSCRGKGIYRYGASRRAVRLWVGGQWCWTLYQQKRDLEGLFRVEGGGDSRSLRCAWRFQLRTQDQVSLPSGIRTLAERAATKFVAANFSFKPSACRCEPKIRYGQDGFGKETLHVLK